MEVYNYCYNKYIELVARTVEIVPTCKSDIITNEHVPYLGVSFFEMSFISKKMGFHCVLTKEIDQYISLWKKFCNPENDIMPVKERYEIYINDAIKWTKEITHKIIFRIAYKKFHHESFNPQDYESHKRKAFDISIGSMIIEKKIRKINDSNSNNSLDKLITAAEIISLEEDIELKSEQLTINSTHNIEKIVYRNEVNSLFESVIKEQVSVHHQLVKYINGHQIESINNHKKYHQQILQESEENIKKYKTILDRLTSILKENEQDTSIKTFIDNIKSDVIYIKNRLDDEESIKLKKIQSNNNCSFTKFFDQIMNSTTKSA